MKEAEVRRLVRQQVASIRQSRSGALPATPYVVIEVITRMRTMKAWEGLTATDSIGRALRALVEEVVHGPIQVEEGEVLDEDLSALSPIEIVKKVKARKHRHLQEPPSLRKTG
jgi:hypothetical protein